MTNHVKLSVNITEENAAHLREAATVYGNVTNALDAAIQFHKQITEAVKEGHTVEIARNGWFTELEVWGYGDQRPKSTRVLQKIWDFVK